uniref:Secreted protein n=1 Tax=Ascaris lumbricoides TaxID=6252 RepID=A0A0M3HWR3_ASCLU
MYMCACVCVYGSRRNYVLFMALDEARSPVFLKWSAAVDHAHEDIIQEQIVAAGTQPLIWSVIRLHWRPPTTPLGGHHADCLTTCTASSSLASVLLLSIRLQQ